MSVRLSLHLKLELEVQRASSLEGKTEVKWEEQGQVGPQAQAGAPGDGVEAVLVLATSALGGVGGSLLPVMGPPLTPAQESEQLGEDPGEGGAGAAQVALHARR